VVALVVKNVKIVSLISSPNVKRSPTWYDNWDSN
jgi:hypothetical protein